MVNLTPVLGYPYRVGLFNTTDTVIIIMPEPSKKVKVLMQAKAMGYDAAYVYDEV